MGLAKSHGLQHKKDRKAAMLPTGCGNNMLVKAKEYNAADAIIDDVYVDIANGVSRSDVLQKLRLGVYDSQEKEMTRRRAEDYYRVAMDRFAVDCDIEAEKLRNLFWGRYETLYAEAVKNHDVYNARSVLDSMAKIFLGVDGKNKNDKATINIRKEGDDIEISFGFGDNNNNEENNIIEAESVEVN